MQYLLTSGCGISQREFKHYPIWVHFPTLTHKLKHLSMGGPAVGNEFIGRVCKKHILENLDNELVVIIQWTSIGKLDMFVEDPEVIKQIKTFNLRNFIVDMKANIVENRGFWASSHSDDNIIKELYIQSKIYDHIRDLEQILDVQNLCELHNIPYYFFYGYSFDFEFIDSIKELEHLRNNIKWDKFVIHTPIYDLYKESDHYQYRIFQDPRFMSPMPSFHIDFYVKHIAPILDTYFTTINFDIDKLKEYCVEITNKIYYEYNNVH